MTSKIKDFITKYGVSTLKISKDKKLTNSYLNSYLKSGRPLPERYKIAMNEYLKEMKSELSKLL